ncbi:hypothetical protein BZG36_02983 [Bifiguratus adelaidae]|uniref:Mitochondrial distribution and morphology protein 12 n=1 Tax=Bifiguratus adelaidae TaxID=1938954 RepID=A0A261XYB9_9FUNG|nr:hypothetical protein BZG36_02983 [Bifiguratus adelaidae]
MSLDINWKVLSDPALAQNLQKFLNDHFSTIQKPPYIGQITVSELSWGDVEPAIEILDICDVFDEFYEHVEDDEANIGGRASLDIEQDFDDGVDNDLSQELGTMSEEASYLYRAPSEVSLERSTLASIQAQMQRPPSSMLTPTPVHHYQHLYQQPLYASPRSPSIPFQALHRSPLVAPHHPFSLHPDSPQPFSQYPQDARSISSSTPEAFFDQRASMSSFASHPDTLAQMSNTSRLSYGFPSQTMFPTPSSKTPSPTPSLNAKDTRPASTQSQKVTRPPTDFQVHASISYKGNVQMVIHTELVMRYADTVMLTLPIRLTVTGLDFEAELVVGVLSSQSRLAVCFVEPHEAGQSSLLRNVTIESEVGDKDRQVLKNVGKIERFVVDQLRKMLDEDFVWPSWHSVDYS